MTDQTQENPSPKRPRLSAVWFTLRMIEVRLRFVAVLVAIGLVIGYWDTLQNYWDRWTRPAVAAAPDAGSDTEFYCPMDPSVVRPGLEPNGSIPKCPICGMPLSLRKKGAPMELPPGVVGRVSLTPDRVRMAGIRTSEIGLRPMTRELRTVGTVTYDEALRSQIVSRVGGYVEELLVDKTFVRVEAGEPLAEIYSPELVAAVQELKVTSAVPRSPLTAIARDKIRLLGVDDAEIESLLSSRDPRYRVVIRSPRGGIVIQKAVQQGSTVTAGQMLFEVADLSSVWIEADVYEKDLGLLRVGQEVEATIEAYPDRVFGGRVSLIYPELNAMSRTARVRFDVSNEGQLLRAGMFANVTLETPVQQTEPFRSLLVSTQTPAADPAEAIARQRICPVTGADLGSMGEPVAAEANGQRVYLCCAGCENAIAEKPDFYLSRIRKVSDDGVLSVPESAVIDTGEQRIVYVEREPGIFEGVEVELGPKSDGYYSVIAGLLPGDQVAAAGAFLIDAETRLNPAASASYFGASGSPGSGSTAAPQNTSEPSDVSDTSDTSKPSDVSDTSELPTLTPEQLAEITKLPAAQQTLAREQVLCPVTLEPLGSMGVPLAVDVRGETVLVCCKGCVRQVQKNADEMLERVNRWRAQGRAAAAGGPS